MMTDYFTISIRLQFENKLNKTDKIGVLISPVWRRKRDLNPRYAFTYYSLSRGAPSASWVFLQSCCY